MQAQVERYFDWLCGFTGHKLYLRSEWYAIFSHTDLLDECHVRA